MTKSINKIKLKQLKEENDIIESQLKEAQILKAKREYLPIYHIDCVNCGFYKVIRGRPIICPNCEKNLIEIRYLN